MEAALPFFRQHEHNLHIFYFKKNRNLLLMGEQRIYSQNELKKKNETSEIDYFSSPAVMFLVPPRL